MEEKTELLINSGIKLFSRYGPKKTSIDDIVREAGVGKGTFYLYFKNKQELYEKIVYLFFEEGRKNIIKLIDKKNEKKDKKKHQKEFIYNSLLLSLDFFKDNEIMKNIISGEENFYFGEINKEKIKNHHINFLKEILDDEKLDYNFISFVIGFYTNVLNMKSCFEYEKEFKKFYKKLAETLVDGIVK